ncbi:MAG: FkbM family methyltransferase [Candidatus Goldiibacteriota bacterium]
MRKIISGIYLSGGRFSVDIMRLLSKSKYRIKHYGNSFDIICDNKRIRMSYKHILYLRGILQTFDHFFYAVLPVYVDGYELVDFSTPRYHKVYGFDLHPIIFPSFAEPVLTTEQYLDFAELKEGSVALDLGSYSGLTSILFSQKAGKTGMVIAVDADKKNIRCIKENFLLYKNITGMHIDLLEGAVWENNEGIDFSHEGNLGSSAVSIVGKHRDKVEKVKTFTLDSIVEKYELKRLDFIKCDIEGAETVIFKNQAFFKKFKPRIIIEIHYDHSKSTLDICKDILAKYGYSFKVIKQIGFDMPLLECYPDRKTVGED